MSFYESLKVTLGELGAGGLLGKLVAELKPRLYSIPILHTMLHTILHTIPCSMYYAPYYATMLWLCYAL